MKITTVKRHQTKITTHMRGKVRPIHNGKEQLTKIALGLVFDSVFYELFENNPQGIYYLVEDDSQVLTLVRAEDKISDKFPHAAGSLKIRREICIKGTYVITKAYSEA